MSEPLECVVVVIFMGMAAFTSIYTVKSISVLVQIHSCYLYVELVGFNKVSCVLVLF